MYENSTAANVLLLEDDAIGTLKAFCLVVIRPNLTKSAFVARCFWHCAVNVWICFFVFCIHSIVDGQGVMCYVVVELFCEFLLLNDMFDLLAVRYLLT